MSKIKYISLLIFSFFVFAVVTSYASSPIVSTNWPIQQAIVYEAPQWGLTGPMLTKTEVAKKFNVAIYARNQMNSNLSNYLSAGYKGINMVYLIGNEIYGPKDLVTTSQQQTLCTDDQKQVGVWSSSVTMDTGDFCEIHDAIINHTALTDYSDIYPTENWFLHKADGSRYFETFDSFAGYVPNQGDVNWRTYFSRRALRELANTDPNHAPVANATGLFIDNIALSWDLILGKNNQVPPNEYTTNQDFVNAWVGFTQIAYQTLHGGTYNFPIWGNMTADPNTGTSWNAFLPYLDGGMNESFVLNWGNGLDSNTNVLNEMTQADSYISQGKEFVAVVQGSSAEEYDQYALSVAMLVTDGSHVSYKYSNYAGGYNQYFEIPQFFYALGKPTAARVKTATNPLTYTRKFQCGSISVNFTKHTDTISLTKNCKVQ